MKEWVLTADRYLNKDQLGKLMIKAEELRTLGVAKRRKQPVRDWILIRLCVFSGLRAGEMCRLKCSDLFIGYGRAELLVQRGKGGKKRIVRIGKELKTDLRWYLKWKHEQGELHPESCLLRSQRSEQLTTSAVWRRWKKYCPLHRLHDARHTSATLLYEATRDLRLVQKQLGHSRPSVTAIYADVCDEAMRDGLAAMDRLVKSAMRRPRNSGPLAVPQVGAATVDDTRATSDEPNFVPFVA
jgi:integrase